MLQKNDMASPKAGGAPLWATDIGPLRLLAAIGAIGFVVWSWLFY